MTATPELIQPEPAAAIPGRLTFKVIGVGQTGCRVASQMTSRSLPDVSLAAVDTDSRALADAGLPESVLLGERTTRGLSAGGDATQARTVAESEIERLRALCRDCNIVFVVAGLGRGTGTGVSPVLARVAHEQGALVLGIVTLPFEFEGPQLHRLAQQGLEQFRAEADAVICLPHQAIGKLLDANTSIGESERITFDLLADGVIGIWRILTRRGFLSVDFSDLCGVLRGRHADSSMGSAEAAGEHPEREVVEKVLAHPLLGESQALAKADVLLISIAGGPELTRAQVSWIVDQLRRQAENAEIVLGASSDSTMAGRLALTVVTARRRDVVRPRPEPEPASQPVVPRPVSSSEPQPSARSAEIDTSYFSKPGTTRPPARMVPPAPVLTSEEQQRILKAEGSSRARRAAAKMSQGMLPLEVVAKGRFDKSEATVRDGQDLDIPTFLRRGIALN